MPTLHSIQSKKKAYLTYVSAANYFKDCGDAAAAETWQKNATAIKGQLEGIAQELRNQSAGKYIQIAEDIENFLQEK